MRTRNFTNNFMLGVVLLAGAAAFAENKGDLQVSTPVTVAGVRLSSGDYSLAWEGSGPDVELKIMRGSKMVATTHARVVSLDRASPSGATIRKNNTDGSESLSQILFGGKKYALAIGDEASAGVQQGSH